MIKNVVVRKPGKNFADGITTSNLGKPDYEKALKQHEQYIEALRKCGCNVIILDADERYPDSTFVEDVAIVTEKCAIITKPGAKSRKGEEKEIINVLKKFYSNIEFLSGNACLDGGDILRFENHFYIGQSKRTNVDDKEAYSANCILINNHVIVPKGFPNSKKALVDAGYKIVEVEMSEFQKMDGGLTCLSLRMPVDNSN
ncbi:N(G),N(G)-dimethylarginine dimethylaminohydrolase [Clostridium sp. P21]|uniref:N(G),N(G)-dimethylarginine dimethylaminohydrolase n=1 Tax=Clostridium muellerianum TaxID=2716538 RepID=A0A7Y0EGJ6_9CLOT|nr:arginine deiminase-related protein [Clostridium muellerianum]NMM63101.1 N(G),N(G)-dimethylarginine dimethylaminohydrolase [Clostridium muellerianum]